MAKYIKQEIPDLNGTGRTQAYYKMQLRPMTHQQFVSMCAKGGTLDESTLLAALSRISDRLALFMAEGFSVKLDGIGTFHAKLGVMSDKEPDAFEEGEQKRNAKSIHVTGVSYKTDPQIVREMRRTCVLEKGGESRIRKPKLTLEERIEKAREFLKKEMFMKVPDYVTLTGLSASPSVAEEARNTTSCGRKSNLPLTHTASPLLGSFFYAFFPPFATIMTSVRLNVIDLGVCRKDLKRKT